MSYAHYISKLKLILLCLFLLFVFESFVAKPFKTHAQFAPPVSNSMTISVNVDDTTLIVYGEASPRAQVTFLKGDVVIGTTQASLNARFEKQLPALHEGLNDLRMYYTDVRGFTSSTVRYEINLQPQSDTSINNLVLPPTIDIESRSAVQGERVRVLGRTVPNSEVYLFFFDDKKTIRVDSDDEGNWSTTIETEEFAPKKYKLYAKVLTKEAIRSKESKSVVLEILPDPDAQDEPEEVQVPTRIIEEVFECTLPKYFSPFDTNSTCKIDYNEYLILVRDWYEEWQDEEDCDVDEDNDCDLVDFSVIMYYVDR